VKHNDFADELDLGRGDAESRRAYISHTITVAADDARNLVVMATVAVGIVVFLIKDSARTIRNLSTPFPHLAAAAACALLISAGLMFWYAAHVNRKRMSLARCLITSDAKKARDLWAGPEHGILAQHRKLLWTGRIFMGAGLLLSAAVAAKLLLK